MNRLTDLFIAKLGHDFFIYQSMVFSGKIVVSTVKISATVWQVVACLPERLTNEELIYLFFRFPLQQMRRLTRCLWIFLLTPPNLDDDDSDYMYISSGDDDFANDNDDDLDDRRYITFRYYSNSHTG